MSKLSKEGEILYASCLNLGHSGDDTTPKHFFQEDLTTLVKCGPQELMNMVQELVDHQLFRTMRLSGVMCWTIRPKNLARSMSTLSEPELMIFKQVEDAHTAGIWIKKIKQVTHIAPNEVQKIVGKLEKLDMIKYVKSVKSPAQRIYMLSHLAPSDDVTGGSFFDAGDLDESLVEELSNLIIFRVRSESWIDAKRRVKREASVVDIDDDEQAASRRKKRKRTPEDIEDSAPLPPPPPKHRSKSRHRDPDAMIQLAYQAGTRGYPTAADVHDFVTTSNAIRAAKATALTIQEVQGLIDVLVWDDKLEKVGSGYRTVRGVSFKQPGAYEFDNFEDVIGNGLSETPCGRCPVFDLCKEGGPVNASNCIYYGDWLKA